MRKITAAIIFLFFMSSFCLGTVISDIDKSDIELSTRFDGTSLLVFGAISHSDDGVSLLVEVVGPPKSVDIIKKVQIWGIWVNKKIAQFQSIPTFYQISISNPKHPNLKEIKYQKLKSIFYDFLETTSISENDNSKEKFHNELTRLKKKLGNLSMFEEQIIVIENKLFSYKVNLPKKIYPGIYKIKMTLIDQGGTELSKSEQSVNVSKVGLQEFLSSNSKNSPVFYGLFSVIIALFLGFSAAQLFRWLYR
ncbi:TIGR02186 family protein [Paracoccaceae bacterium]|nr:TIGR02186 family protein [Paracoccaceae bacterium]